MSSAGLDPAHLAAALPSRALKFQALLPLVREHLSTHSGYVAWSGGKDSTVVVDLARRALPNVPICLFDSGLEFPENMAYVSDLADRWALNLHVLKAIPDALTVMRLSGAWDHQAPPRAAGPSLHEALISIPASEAVARFGHGELTGLRAQESGARQALLLSRQGRYVRANTTRVYAPLWDWRDLDVNAYLAQHDIPENPVYARLRSVGAAGRDLRVGVAFDGNNLQYGRASWLRRGWPDLYAQIEAALPRVREWR